MSNNGNDFEGFVDGASHFEYIITSAQHGFMSCRSTVTNLLNCVNEWSACIDIRGCIDVLYIDIAKAFDSVSHEKLIFKLEKCGVRGKFLSWIRSFLRNRTQSVKTGEKISGATSVTSGVPQGSVLGSVLFLIYINDLVDVLSNCSVSIFADDSKLYFKADTDNDISAIQRDIDSIMTWCDEWQLTVAASKCNVLHIGRHNRKHAYQMGGSQIPSVSSVKDLGIMVSEDLSFSPHIASVSRAAFARCNLIFRAFSTRNLDCLLKAYITYDLRASYS